MKRSKKATIPCRPRITIEGETTYDWAWRQASKDFLAQPENVWCRQCLSQGKYSYAEVTDHIIPHRGNWKLFWDRDNWQPLDARCHNRKSRSEM